MTTVQESPTTLLKLIHAKREKITAFVKKTAGYGNSLIIFNIICSGLATLLTGWSANNAAANPQRLQSVCIAAMILSFVAGITTAIHSRFDMASKLSKAQTCSGKLEGLEALLAIDQVTIKAAGLKYDEYVKEVSFITAEGSRASINTVTGNIKKPQDGEDVNADYFCSGEVSGHENSNGTDIYFWLVVEIDGLLWPKEKPVVIQKDGTWCQQIYQDGEADKFAIALYAADATGHNHINQWLANYSKVKKYPPIDKAAGMNRIARVTVRSVRF